MTKTTKIHNSIQLLAPRPYLKVLSQFIHQSIDSRKRCHVNKPLAWRAYLLWKTFWEVVGVEFYSTVRLNFLYWQFKKTDGLLVYDVKLSLNAQRFDDTIQIKYVQELDGLLVRDIINAAPLYSFCQSLLTISWLFAEFFSNPPSGMWLIMLPWQPVSGT